MTAIHEPKQQRQRSDKQAEHKGQNVSQAPSQLLMQTASHFSSSFTRRCTAAYFSPRRHLSSSPLP